VAKQIIDDRIWAGRIPAADKYYADWEKLFRCDILDKYYEGFQWKSQTELAYNPYTINKIYETIQIKIASFIPTFPKYLVSSKPANEDSLEAASASANLKGDLLNTIIQDFGSNFSEELEQIYKDSFFRFGMAEVGYEADWIINPNAPKPLLGKDTDTQLSEARRQRIIQEPPEIPQNERVFVRHIPAKTFRIGGMDNKYLNHCGWCGYYDYINKDELLALPKLLNREKLETAIASAPFDGIPGGDGSETIGERWKKDGVKIWRIWDARAQVRVLVLDNPFITIFQRKFDRLPLFDLRPDKRLILNGFYPIPPAFHWISPQDEYNEIREMLRAHRRRFLRKFQVLEGMMDDEEIEKFETGPDGALCKVKRDGAIKPIDNAALGPELGQASQTSSLDLHEISGTTSEAHGIADRTTATQATIVNQRAGLRETKERDRVVKLYCEIGREILLTIRDNFTGKTVIRLTQPEGEAYGQNVRDNSQTFKFIQSEDLNDGYDFKIDVDLTTLSVAAQEEEKKKLFEFTAYLQQNPFVAFSPYLIREAAMRIGYRNEKAIAEFQQMALLMELARMNQLKAMAGQAQGQMPMPDDGSKPAQMLQQATPPGQEEIRQQLANQPAPGQM
jgi:hypothetical protein